MLGISLGPPIERVKDAERCRLPRFAFDFFGVGEMEEVRQDQEEREDWEGEKS